MLVVPAAGDELLVDATVLAAVKSVRQDPKKMFGEFFLCKEFNTISTALTIGADGFISQYIEITAEVGKGNTISDRNRYIGVVFIKSFNGKS